MLGRRGGFVVFYLLLCPIIGFERGATDTRWRNYVIL